MAEGQPPHHKFQCVTLRIAEELALFKRDAQLKIGTNPKKLAGLKGEAQLKKDTKVPYNYFKVITHTRIYFDKTTGQVKYKEEKDKFLEAESKRRLGLNVEWLNEKPGATRQLGEEKIRELHLKFPYWGHLIHNSIQDFNKKYKDKCRKLVYDLRHGEADHNAWKKRMRAAAKAAGKPENQWDDEWCKDPEYKRKTGFEYPNGSGKKHDIVDPPLTGNGEDQAREAGRRLLRLKEHLFPIPKSAYVSPLYRAMQTFELAFASVGLGAEEAIILHDLREEQTGNCADILSNEFASKIKKPPHAGPAGKGVKEGWMETKKDVMIRAKRVHEDIFEMDDSDCVARVTHSLLIRHNLMNLVGNNQTVVESFMLDEGGLFAYVIEGKTTDPERSGRRKRSLINQGKLEDFMERKNREASKRYETKFPLTEVASGPVSSKPVPSKPVPSKAVAPKPVPSKNASLKPVGAKQKGGTSSGMHLGQQNKDQRSTHEDINRSRCR